MSVEEIIAELQRLAQCADIPPNRRRALLRLADGLSPEPRPSGAGRLDYFLDGYYRRAGIRMRKKPDLFPLPHDKTVRAMIASRPKP